jgi:2-alkyl-3-oxoalkanoate reductase
MLKVGIIGATGFIGRRIVEVFCLENVAEVRPLVRSSSSLSSLAHLNLQGSLADALDQSSLYNAIAGCDVIVHCPAGSPWFIRKTVAATYQASVQAKIPRLVYLSTASVHGQAPVTGTDESSPLSDRQFLAYNNAKVQAERKLLELRSTGNTEVVFIRPGIVVGPRSGWIGGFANSLRSQTAYLVNEGKGICNSIYIDNLVHAIRLALTAPNVDGQAFLVGDKEQVTWADLYRPIADALGVEFSQIPNINITNYTPGFKEKLRETLRNSDLLGGISSLIASKRQKNSPQAVQQPGLNQEMASLYLCQYKFPDRKAEQVLNYSPIVSFSEACDRTIKWLASEGLL